MRKQTLLKSTLSALALAAGLAFSTSAGAGTPPVTPPPGTPNTGGPMIYVTSQDTTYATIVLGALPTSGPFQQLFADADGLSTEFGPGDVGYLGGRWWVDADGDGTMNEGDVFFLCPLLGPVDPS